MESKWVNSLLQVELTIKTTIWLNKFLLDQIKLKLVKEINLKLQVIPLIIHFLRNH